MGLLGRTMVLWGLATAFFLVLVAVLMGVLTGLDTGSVLAGLLLGLSGALAYLILRVLVPLDRSLAAMADGSLPDDHPFRSRCGSLLADARSGRALEKTLSTSADRNAISAAEVSYAADQLKLRLDRQVEEIMQMTDYAGRITDSVRESTQQATDAATMAHQASAISEEGRKALTEAIDNVRRVHQQSGENLRLIQELNEKSGKIQSVTATIQGIAEQTNLLALNAAIEAARAGEQGRGFAVVADEVRQLAGRTAQATTEVSETLEEIRSDTAQIVQRIEDLARGVDAGLTSVESVGERLEQIREQSDRVQQQVARIAEIDRNNEQSLSQVFSAIETLRDHISESDRSVADLADQAGTLMELAEQANAAFALNSDASYHRFFFEKARDAARQIAALFEEAIRDGRITEEDLFDSRREPIPGTEPQKYRTRFDGFTDQYLPAIQETILGSHDALVFAIACARDGYVPTHNRAFAHEPTGDPEVDLVRSRSKRLFNDRTGIRCGSHTEPMLLQTYRRDTGEIMHDLSVPIFVKGRHWGGFRLGYRPEAH